MLRVCLLAALVACVPLSYTYTPASQRPFAARAENCVIEVVTGPPTADYEEVGILEHYNGEPPTDIDKFRDAVRERVCRVGGDAVIASKNDKGQWVKGRIIKYPDGRGPAS